MTAARYAPQTRIKGPGQTGGKAGIAIGGLGAAAATVASCLNPIAILTCPTMVLTMGALGATAGGVIGHQINAQVTGSKIEATGPEDLNEPRTQTVLRDRVVAPARAKTPLDYVVVNDPAPATPADQPDYRALAASGIDTVVEVALLEVSTEGRPGRGLWLALNSRIRVVRTASGELRAFSATCTHLDCTVQYRADLEHLWCACHNGHYDLNDRNISGPPPRPLEGFEVNLKDGDIVIARRSS